MLGSGSIVSIHSIISLVITGDCNNLFNLNGFNYFMFPRTEPLGTEENARVQVAELTEAITNYEYAVTHPYKHVVAYKSDTFLGAGNVLAVLACK